MNKEEILSKSRNENKGRDLYEDQVYAHAGAIGSLISLLLATILFIVQSLVGKGFNFALYAIIFSLGATSFTIKAISMKRKRDLIGAIVYITATLFFSCVHIYQLLGY